MRRAVLTFAIAAGLAIGTAIPTSAIGETQVTLNCSDGTSTALIVDTNTLVGLTGAVQAMIDYPAGLNCSLVQNPLGALFGDVALASPGQRPFIVGGGRWQVRCEQIQPPPPCCGRVEGGVVAKAPGSWSSSRVASAGSDSLQLNDEPIWVNIAVNVHESDDGSFFGTLNETIPANQFCDGNPVGESHFTSKPLPLTGCLNQTSPPEAGPPGQGQGYPRPATVTSRVTRTSGLPFPGAALGADIHFSFIDHGNPGKQLEKDKLQGPPAEENSACPALFTPPAFELVHGNISVHP
jgi:hypothetical protein